MSINFDLKKFRIPLKPGHYASWRILSLIVMGGLIFSAGLTAYFVYLNIFSALANANAIIILGPEVNMDTLNLSAFDKAQKLITSKKQTPDIPAAARNIFEYPPAATSTPHATSTKK